MRLGGVGQRFTCSVESGVRVHRPGACVTATTALDYASRDCRHVELDPCHMTPGRVVRHHCRHDTSRCRTTPPSYDTSRCRTTPPSYDTSGPSYDTTVVRHLGSVVRHHRRTTPPGVVRRTTHSCDVWGLALRLKLAPHLWSQPRPESLQSPHRESSSPVLEGSREGRI